MIRTINLNSSEIKVTGLGGDNTEIFNNSCDTVYASRLPNIVVGGDEVIAIPAGAIDGLYGTHGTVYLLGTGSVELRGVDYKITKSRGQIIAGNGGTGVSSNYVDEKCSMILGSAKAYADEKNSETLESAKQYADSLNAELTGYIGYTDSDIYGLEADFKNCVFTRLAGAVGKTAGADFDCVNAYGGRRRCNLSDSGEVLAYYGDENFKSDGSNGQVMVEQPKFYYRVVPLKTEKIDGADGYHLRKARYYISDTPKAGFKVHPAFVRNGIEVDKIYLSAFEGCIYDTSAETYLPEDEQVADFDNDKLSSVAGVKPCSGKTQLLTRANARKLAHNRGAGWELFTIQAVSATQVLFIIEYATFNSQNAVGLGAVNKAASSLNLAEQTGATLLLENNTGTIINTNNVQFTSYRGEENLWGNIWTYIDGVNVTTSEDSRTQLCIADNNFVDSASSYKNTMITPCLINGYISRFGYSADYDWLFVPTENIGNNSLPIGSYAWGIGESKAECKSFKLGGSWYESTNAGIFCFSMNGIPSSHWSSFGARLQYIGI